MFIAVRRAWFRINGLCVNHLEDYCEVTIMNGSVLCIDLQHSRIRQTNKIVSPIVKVS